MKQNQEFSGFTKSVTSPREPATLEREYTQLHMNDRKTKYYQTNIFTFNIDSRVDMPQLRQLYGTLQQAATGVTSSLTTDWVMTQKYAACPIKAQKISFY